MKRYQKITGVVALFALAAYDYYAVTSARIGIQTYKGAFITIADVKGYAISQIDRIGLLVLAHFVLLVILFICLWRKGKKS